METVKHILNIYEPKGFSLYKKRHDRAILIVLWRLLKEYGFKQEEPWYKLEAKPVYENRSVKILWDPSIPTDEENDRNKLNKTIMYGLVVCTNGKYKLYVLVICSSCMYSLLVVCTSCMK